MIKLVTKRFPADTSLNKGMTFLTDKKINAELYSYLLSLSFPENGETIVKKSAIPK